VNPPVSAADAIRTKFGDIAAELAEAVVAVAEALQVRGALDLAWRGDTDRLRGHLAQMSPDTVSRLSTAAAVLVTMTMAEEPPAD
jgi:hypothetical protein